jgi:predicted dehydrogenase
VTAVCSSSLSHARDVAARFGIPFAFDNFDACLDLDQLDLVVVAVPPYLHYPIVMRALERNRNVLCEKPLALNSLQAQALYETAKEKGVKHYLNHQLRFDPNRVHLKAVIEDGFIGDVRHLVVNYVTNYRAAPDLRWDWWSEEAKGGGLLGASGSHVIDWLLWMFGTITDVVAERETFTRMLPAPRDSVLLPVETEDYVALLLTLGGSIPATVTISASTPCATGMQVQIYGTGGIVSLDADGNVWGRRENESPNQNLSVTPGTGANVWGNAFQRYVMLLADSLVDGKVLESAATFQDGLRCQEVLDATRASWKERRYVRITKSN